MSGMFSILVNKIKESFDSYVTRIRKFASSCKFGTLTDELIRDKLVIGIIDRGTKEKL